MPTEMLTKDERRAPQTPAPTAAATEKHERSDAARAQVRRERLAKINAAAWALGTILLTTLWAVNQWQANGALKSFGHEGDPGQWNPTLWALGVGIWGLIVGVIALRAYVGRPPTEAEVDRELARLRPHAAAGNAPAADLRRVARGRLDRVRRVKFHVGAWVLGMIVLTPLWALIEWQDNGGFERFSNDSRPGEWEPWILYVGGIWALVIATLAVQAYVRRPAAEADIKREIHRLRSRI